MPLIETPPTPEQWRPIRTIENVVQTAEFLFKNGSVVRGDWRPYGCGSDCPCYDLESGPDTGPDALFTQYPMCWCVWVGSNALDDDPTYWRAIPA